METDRDLATRLLDAEQRAGSVPALQARIADLEELVRRSRDDVETARRQAGEDRDRLTRVTRELVEVKRSAGWRLTRPLRAARRLTS